MRTRIVPTLLFAGTLSTTAFAGITLSPNVKDGDKISGEYTFRIGVTSDSLVTSVEFYVGKDLRDTDESTPYEFTVDTLTEPQGEFEVTFAAFNKAGESVKRTVKVTIDNGLNAGIGAHLDKARDAVAQGNWDEAIAAAKVALKIDANSNPARLLMARANVGKGVFDMAEKYVGDVLASSPNDAEALSVASTVYLRKAFATAAAGGDQMSAATAMNDALLKATTYRRAALDHVVDSIGTIDDSNRMAKMDALIGAGAYSRVISELDPIFKKDFRNNDVANRLIYSQIRAGRFSQAVQAIENVKKYGSADGYGYALRSCLKAYFGETAEALDAEKEAILDDPTGLGVKTAQAYLALRRADTKTAANILTSLANAEGQDPVINYDICALAFMASDFDQSRTRFETALLAEPAAYDVLVERANQAVYFSLRTDMEKDPDYAKRQRLLAKGYLDAALGGKPGSFEALTGLSIVALMDGRSADAIKMGRAAVAAGPDYAPAHWAYAAALFTQTGETARDLAKEEVKKAETLDPNNLEGKSYPNARTAWEYFFGKGRIPWLIAPGK
ncbi:MAG: hypothetical protein JST30_01335 [Armatimonadetes bacterium]|nr:hypothetical protein [Armatimonadota bacterium]